MLQFFNPRTGNVPPREVLQVGDCIEITNLPNPRNHPFTKSAYIGMKGVLTEIDSEGGMLFTGTSYLVLGPSFSYKFLHNYKLPK